MKKYILILISFFSIFIYSCSEYINKEPVTYLVTFKTGYRIIYTTQEVLSGKCVIRPEDPVKNESIFLGWTLNGEEYDFSLPVTSNLEIIAKFDHIHEFVKTVVEPTCTSQGYTYYECKCKENYKDNFTGPHILQVVDEYSGNCLEQGNTAGAWCTKCGYRTFEYSGYLPHDLEYYEGKTPTETEVGWYPYEKCLVCPYNTYEEISLFEEVNVIYESRFYGKLIKFGRYPQRHVSNQFLINQLNKLTSVNENGYYEYNGCEYTKAIYEGETFDHWNHYSDGTFFENGTLHWFKVEPIIWKVIGEFSDGNYLLITEDIIDSLSYAKLEQTNEGETKIKANNYEFSNVREFINNSFLSIAFNHEEQKAIQITEVGNLVENEFGSENIFDKIFILSEYECESYSRSNNIQSICTDYVLNKAYFSSVWMLRSTFSYGEYIDLCFKKNCFYGKPVETFGLRPSIILNLNELNN